MIRTKTTLVIGAGAGAEIELPDRRELLNKVAQGFDFSRLGTELQTRDMQILASHFEKFPPGGSDQGKADGSGGNDPHIGACRQHG